MATISSFFSDKWVRERYVAAQKSRKNRLYYCAMNSPTPIPPSVYVWAYTKANNIGVYREIYTNYPATWLNTYSPWEYNYRNCYDESYYDEYQVRTLSSSPWAGFGLAGLGAKPNLTELYEDTLSYAESRARRVYMLAAFCVLKKYGRVNRDRSLGHNIGSLLVSNEGEVLSWGVNTGGFCHAEINTLLGYFAKNPDKATLPANSSIFTTLKPCLMCSTLIKDTQNRGSKLKAWYGMIDEGRQGGTPLLGKMANEFTGEDIVGLDVFELMSEKGTLDTATRVTGSKPVKVGAGRGKVDLAAALNASGGGHGGRGRGRLSAAEWVDESDEVWRLIEDAVKKFRGKADKADREDGPMKAALNYLKGWALVA
jgi:hypothetical protein